MKVDVETLQIRGVRSWIGVRMLKMGLWLLQSSFVIRVGKRRETIPFECVIRYREQDIHDAVIGRKG